MAHGIHSIYEHSGVDELSTFFFSFLYAVFMLVLIRKLSHFRLVRCVYSATITHSVIKSPRAR